MTPSQIQCFGKVSDWATFCKEKFVKNRIFARKKSAKTENFGGKIVLVIFRAKDSTLFPLN